MIACGHCGGRHASVAEVRGCSTDPVTAPEVVRPTPVPADLPTPPRPPLHPPVPAVVLVPDWPRLAGPAALARNVVVAPEATAPAPWAEAPRIVVDGSPDAEAKLAAARADRTRVVIELAIALPDPDPVLEVDYWHLDPATTLDGETIRHLVFGHAVDARDPERPTIAAVSQAIAAGATRREEGPGDVDTPHGPAWCDGGPLDWFDHDDLGAPVIPAVHLGRGSLAPIRRHHRPAAELAPDQLEAVAHAGGAARIIAPAGSGKTRVLTERARHLVRDRGIDPGAICLVAFNVRAREEMQQRTRDLAGLEIRTLNSLALAVLTGRPPFLAPAGRRAPRVIDEREVRRVLDDLVGGRRVAMADPMAAWIEALTASRLGLRSPAAVEREFGGDVRDLTAVLPAYRERLARAGAVDFDEQILGAIEVLCRDPAARSAARQTCAVLLVDEFQDLTPAHVLLIRLLAGPAAEVFGVGDDDQTIYGYSGASPAWLIDFADLFPGATAHDLHVNYRCPPAVVEAATNLLTRNGRRIAKSVMPAPGRTPQPGELRVIAEDDPMATTLRRVRDLLDDGVAAHDIAVLTRVNATLLGPMLCLSEAGVPTAAPVDLGFLERTGVAGALAWMRLAVAPERSLPGDALETAVRRPPRGLSRRVAGWVGEQRSPREIDALATRLSQARDTDRVSSFADDVRTIRTVVDDGGDTATVLAAIRDGVGLGRALDQRLDASRRSVDRSAHGDDLAALEAVASLHPDPATFGDWIADRLRTIQADPRGVRLSTIHRVKGREWPHVVIHDVTAGLFPHRLAADREEERRVFHVALTRGAESVTVAAGTPPSPFLSELDEPGEPEPVPSPADPARPSRTRRAAAAAAPGPDSVTEGILRERLRAWRLQRSRDDGVPAFVVANDATLYEVARRCPTSDDELLTVPGIGPAKLEKYGADILALVAAALVEHGA